MYLAITIVGSETDSTTSGAWGTFGGQDLCPPGEFAVGFELKSEAPGTASDGDDTALNGIRLKCNGGDTVSWLVSCEYTFF